MAGAPTVTDVPMVLARAAEAAGAMVGGEQLSPHHRDRVMRAQPAGSKAAENR